MYKKLLSLVAFALLIEGAAFAGNIPTTTAGGAQFTFKASNNVGMDYIVDSTTAAQAYTINAKNVAGNRVFSSSNNTSNIWYKEDNAWKGKPVTDSAVTKSTTAGDSTYSGWSSQ